MRSIASLLALSVAPVSARLLRGELSLPSEWLADRDLIPAGAVAVVPHPVAPPGEPAPPPIPGPSDVNGDGINDADQVFGPSYTFRYDGRQLQETDFIGASMTFTRRGLQVEAFGDEDLDFLGASMMFSSHGHRALQATDGDDFLGASVSFTSRDVERFLGASYQMGEESAPEVEVPLPAPGIPAPPAASYYFYSHRSLQGLLDQNGDGTPDAVDIDGDGIADLPPSGGNFPFPGVSFSFSFNRLLQNIDVTIPSIQDANGDGIPDPPAIPTIDIDGDGIPDLPPSGGDLPIPGVSFYFTRRLPSIHVTGGIHDANGDGLPDPPQIDINGDGVPDLPPQGGDHPFPGASASFLAF